MISSDKESAIERQLGPHVARLRPGERVSRVRFQGKPFYVLRDPITQRTQRLPAEEYRVLLRMTDGGTLAESFDKCVELHLVEPSEREEFFRFAVDLSRAGILSLPVADGAELYRRALTKRRSDYRGRWLNFLFMRVPMLSPNAFLERTSDYVRPVFTRMAFTFWLLAVVACVLLAMRHWHDLTMPLLNLLELHNLPWLAVTMVVLKAVHELGHGYACKVFGGDVPEMGVIFVVGTPCAYVDASAAWNFPSKTRRIIVSLAGMYFESMFAMASLLIWLATDPGILNTVAYQACALAGITTIIFNINPLMKFDGYFALADLVDVPNLRQASHAALRRYSDRWVLGLPLGISPYSPRRTLALAAFGVCAAVYKVVLVLSISAMVAMQFAAVGLLMATYYIVTTGGGAATAMFRSLWWDSRTEDVRLRARIVCAVLLLGLPGVVLLVPVRLPVFAAGVVGAQRESVVRAGSPGVLGRLLVQPGAIIRKGEPIAVLENPEIAESARRAELELEVTRREQVAAAFQDRLAEGQLRLRTRILAQRTARAREQVDALTVNACMDARVLRCLSRTARDVFVERGGEVALLGSGVCIATVFVEDSLYSTLPIRIGSKVLVRSSAAPGETFGAVVERLPAQADRWISEVAVTQLGGGPIVVDADSREAANSYFAVRLRFDGVETAALAHGTRVTVRFDTARRSLASHGVDRLRRFLDAVRQQ